MGSDNQVASMLIFTIRYGRRASPDSPPSRLREGLGEGLPISQEGDAPPC